MSVIWWTAVCGNATEYDAFWSDNLTIFTLNPDLTCCFQDTLLTWVLVGSLLISLGVYGPFLFRKPTMNGWKDKRALQWIKLVLSGCMLILYKVIAVMTIRNVAAVSSCLAAILRIFGMLIVLLLTHHEYKKGLFTSIVLNVFLLATTVTSIIKARSVWLEAALYQSSIPGQTGSHPSFELCVLYGVVAAGSALLCFLNIPSDLAALHRDPAQFYIDENVPLLGDGKVTRTPKTGANISPQETGSVLSSLVFGWYTRFVHQGNTKYLQFEDTYDLLEKDKCKAIVPGFQNLWEKTFREYTHSLATCQSEIEYFRRPALSVINPDIPHDIKGEYPQTPRPPSLIRVILMSVGRDFWIGNGLKCVQLCFTFLNPIILSRILVLLREDTPFRWKCYGLAIALGVVDLCHTVVINHSLHYGFSSGIQMRTALTAAIYRKVLRLSSAAKKATTTGQIINLISVDAQRIQDSPVFIHNIGTIPFMIVVVLALMWQNTGVSSVVGLSLLVVLIIPLNGIYMSNWIRQLQVCQMLCKDARLKMIGELLSGIKVLKLYAWEKSFMKKIFDIREGELYYMKKSNILSAVSSITWNCTTYLVTFVVLAVYVSITENAVLDANKVFVTSALVNILSVSLSFMPMAVSYLGQAWVAFDRIRDFLLLEELPDENISTNTKPETAILIRKGTFTWDYDAPCALNGIDLHVKQGQLVAIVGRVGSGKSSLVSALLGEMWRLSGEISTKGQIAYIPQQAWIQNMTVRDNILFGKAYNSSRYKAVISACAMETDFKILVDGDMTEIGEKGINLSGGQKQRVSLARAVYQDADLYLFDDPLSAVDAHVGKHLFQKVIGPGGILRDKTRLLVTHSLTYLPHVDNILVMEDGEVVDSGTYVDLLHRDGSFAEFLRQLADTKDEETDPEKDKQDFDINSFSGSLGRSKKIPALHRLHSRYSSRHSDTAQSVGSRVSRSESVLAPRQLVMEELAQEGDLKLSVIRDYVVAGGIFALVITIVFHIFYGGTLIVGSIWLVKWTDDATTFRGNVSREQNMYRMGVYGGIIGFQIISTLIGSIGIAVGSVMASRVLHIKVLDRIVHAPMRFFDTTPLGRIMNRLSRDMDMIDFNVPMQCRQWFFTFVPMISTIIIVSYATPMFLIAVVPMAIIYGLIMRAFVKTVRQLRRIDSIRRSPLFAHFDESVGGASSIRAYNRTEEFIAKSDRLTDDSQRAWYLVLAGQRWLAIILQFLGSTIEIVAAMLAVTQTDTVSTGEAGMSISFTLIVYIYLTFYVRAVSELETYMVSVERIQEYTELETEASWENEGNKPVSSWPDRGNIQFSDYATRYRPGLDLVLKGITCDIKHGEKVGVVGRTGAGKSSIALSLFRIVEAVGGSIRIDGIDISRLGLYDLRGRLTIIPQDPVIFSGSLRLNLDPLDEHTDTEIWRVLDLAHLGDFVSGSSQGLEYECGENGEALSIGQRQLVCLARALLRQSRVLVLDEATAAIDLETDELIQTTIRTAFQDRTILTIAHRINTILDYDRVIVMDAGKIVEFDTPTKLLQDESSVFHGMAKSAGII